MGGSARLLGRRGRCDADVLQAPASVRASGSTTHRERRVGVTLLRIDAGGAVAPYEQLRSQLARMIAEGELTAGQKLPTVRQLAADLGLAANTVARCYRELEVDGIISTQGRRGTFVRSSILDGNGESPVPADAQTAATQFASTARAMGLTLAETTRLVESAWSPGAKPATLNG